MKKEKTEMTFGELAFMFILTLCALAGAVWISITVLPFIARPWLENQPTANSILYRIRGCAGLSTEGQGFVFTRDGNFISTTTPPITFAQFQDCLWALNLNDY